MGLSDEERALRLMKLLDMRSQMRRRQFLRYMMAATASAVVLGACGDGSGSASSNGGSGDTASSGSSDASDEVLVKEVAGYDNPEKWKGRKIVVTSWGGAYQDAQRKAIFEPFMRLTGCEIAEDTSDSGKLRAQVESGNVEWDVYDAGTEGVLNYGNHGLLEEIDYDIADTTDLYEDLLMPWGVGAIYYSTVLAYRTDKYSGDNIPQGWADFWDTEKFPGARSLYNDPTTTLEFALLADGVDPDQLYPQDMDRAFKSLDRIKEAVTVWWDAGAQPAQLLTDGEVDMASAWNGRIDTVQQQGAKVAIQWNQGLLTADSWVVPKGSKNKDVAMDFINFATRPETTAALARLIPYGPVNKKAFDYLDEELARRLPSEPELKQSQIVTNFEWWEKNLDEATERFQSWILE